MEMTTLDNVAIGMMLVLAFLGIIIVVWNCAKLEKRIEKLEKLTIGNWRFANKDDFLTPNEMEKYRYSYDAQHGPDPQTPFELEEYRREYEQRWGSPAN